MGKRTAFEANSTGAHPERGPKRPRTHAADERDSPRMQHDAAEQIATARDLQTALFFDQGATADFRSGELHAT